MERQTTKQEQIYKGILFGHPKSRDYCAKKYALITNFIKPLCYHNTTEIQGLIKHLDFSTSLDEIREDLKDFIDQIKDNIPRCKKTYGKVLVNNLLKLKL